MTPDQIKLVQATFDALTPMAETVGKVFYIKLFDLDPNLEKLFASDMKEQSRKLMNMISVAVKGLEDLDAIVPAVQALGQRHAAYGVRPEDYETVAAALLWVLDQGLGDQFTPEVKNAWATAYTLLATTMKDAAARVAA